MENNYSSFVGWVEYLLRGNWLINYWLCKYTEREDLKNHNTKMNEKYLT